MKSEPATLDDVNALDPDLAILLPTDAVIVRERYNYGEVIKLEKDPQNHTFISIIELGCVEIFNESSAFLGEFHAYRPIKIFERGQNIGSFRNADICVGREGPSREKENWKIVAGRASAILLDSANASFFEPEFHVDSTPPLTPRDLLCQHRQGVVISIIKINLNNNSFGEKLKLLILSRAWHDTKEYRFCKNVYNLEFYEQIRIKIKKHNMYSDFIARSGSSFGKHKYKSMPHLEESIVDALDRVDYDSPFFISSRINKKIEYSNVDGKKFSINMLNLYEAHHISKLIDETFIYPIGLLNYSVNMHFSNSLDDRAEISKVMAPNRPDLEDDGRWIWEIFVNIVLDVYVEHYAERMGYSYPYDVKFKFNSEFSWRNAKLNRTGLALLLEFTKIEAVR